MSDFQGVWFLLSWLHSWPYPLSASQKLDINITPRLPSDYINYLENPLEIINNAEKAAEEDIWALIQFTESLRRQYGKEPRSMAVLLKKLYVRRMADDLGITRIYVSVMGTSFWLFFPQLAREEQSRLERA
ncbi:hypothetical protein Syun_010361 [Stephania yunnanensis]|uniref:Transcription-repair-coupling factor C-terminal domain-containing protein n=1 Tax=Stephania yunnanensis TaxID=152371 RepID=A0AAP0KGC9_9MAGN